MVFPSLGSPPDMSNERRQPATELSGARGFRKKTTSVDVGVLSIHII